MCRASRKVGLLKAAGAEARINFTGTGQDVRDARPDEQQTIEITGHRVPYPPAAPSRTPRDDEGAAPEPVENRVQPKENGDQLCTTKR